MQRKARAAEIACDDQNLCYDPASNLTSITTNGTTRTPTYNNLNEINGATYDANGSPTAIDKAAYLWDGENRVVQYTNTTSNAMSTFTYDGVGRLVRVVNSKNGTVLVDYSYFWCGSTRCLIHSNLNSGAIEDQYFAQGQILFGNSYYYVHDQLGSVVQLITKSGTSAGQYTYDPYGNRTIVSGLTAFDGGYAGYWLHTASGLEFAQNRAYDPIKGRWLNRDPIGEAGGANLYAYAEGNPITLRDPSGLDVTIYNYYNEVSGLGHLGISVNSEPSMGFYPLNPGIAGRALIGLGYDVPGYINFDDMSKTHNSLVIATTPVQDALIASYIANRIQNPGNYNLAYRECADFVIDALSAGKVPVPSTRDFIPNNVFRDLVTLTAVNGEGVL